MIKDNNYIKLTFLSFNVIEDITEEFDIIENGNKIIFKFDAETIEINRDDSLAKEKISILFCQGIDDFINKNK